MILPKPNQTLNTRPKLNQNPFLRPNAMIFRGHLCQNSSASIDFHLSASSMYPIDKILRQLSFCQSTDIPLRLIDRSVKARGSI